MSDDIQNAPARNYLDDIAAALPPSFKDAIREDNKADPHAGLLDNERTFAKLWEAFEPEDKQHYYKMAGLDPNAVTRLEQDIDRIYQAAGQDPKNVFNNIALDDGDDTLPEDYDDEGERLDIGVIGTVDPAEEEEEAAQIRRKKYLKALDEQFQADEEKKRKAGIEADDKNEPKPDPDDEKDEMKFVSRRLGRYAIRDRGDYLLMRGQGQRQNPNGPRMVETEQLRMILLTCILDKKMDSIQFVRNGTIDSQITSQARSLLATDDFLQKALGDKVNTPILTTLQKDPPAWCTNGLSKWMHKRQYNAQMSRSRHQTRESMRLGASKLGDKLVDKDGKTLTQKMKEEAEKTGQPLVPRTKVGELIHSVGAGLSGLFGRKSGATAPDLPGAPPQPESPQTASSSGGGGGGPQDPARPA